MSAGSERLGEGRPGAGWVDGHVHSQFSWDAQRGDMETTCRRALEIGLPALAFTEHADYVQGVHDELRPLDTAGYLEELERCRALFPGLRILAGIELGEPHLHPAEAAQALREVSPERILGSVHVVSWQGGALDASQLKRLAPADAPAFERAHLAETLRLVESDAPFQVLAHLDYPKRYWPHQQLPFSEELFQEELRAVLRALARRGGVLELNTTRGAEPRRGLCPGPTTLRWWREEGGRAIAFGSDSHVPDLIAAGFREAGQVAEAIGFRPSDDPAGYWLR
ncbi:MAG: PHP domain-containing protein [Candidatus Dormibacteraceae bacterium]